MSGVRNIKSTNVAWLLTVGFVVAVAAKWFAGAPLGDALFDHALIFVSVLAIISWFWGAYIVIDRFKKPVIGWCLVVVGIVGLLMIIRWTFS